MAAGILSERRLFAAIAVLALLCFAIASSPASARSTSKGARSCGAIPGKYTGGIRVKHVSCKEAKAVIATYTNRIIKNLQHDWSLTVHHLNCDLVTKYYYGDIHRCVGSGGREIDFWRGSKPPPPKRY